MRVSQGSYKKGKSSQGGRGKRESASAEGRNKGDTTKPPRKQAGDTRFAGHKNDPRFRSTGRGNDRVRELDDEDRRYTELRDRGATFAQSDDPEIGSASTISETELEHLEQLSEADVEMLDAEEDVWSQGEVEETEATRRLAVVNCDWDHIKAEDIFMMTSSHLPLGGKIESVTVYVSQVGKEQLAQERAHGPDLWTKEETEEDRAEAAELTKRFGEAVKESDDDEEGEEVQQGILDAVGEHGEKFSSSKFRSYEMQRMKYYYAVVTFNSVSAAAAVYKECDGVEIGHSGVLLDLRYVTDDTDFDPQDVVSTVTKVSAKYKSVAQFVTAPLRQTRFTISWDRDDPLRQQRIQDAFTDETEDADLAAYLASSSDDETNRDQKRRKERQKYADLLNEIKELVSSDDEAGSNLEDGGLPEDSSGEDDELNRFSDVSVGESDDDDDDAAMGDKEGVIHMGIEDDAQRLQNIVRQRKQLAQSTVGEAQQLKYKQRRKLAKQQKHEMRALEQETRRDQERQEITKQESDKLRNFTGESDEPEISRKQRRKMAAKEKREESRATRESHKKQRMLRELGAQTSELSDKTAAEDPTALRDSRLADRLLNDPRYHVDATHERAKRNKELQALAKATISRRRRGKNSDSATDLPLKRRH